MNRAVQLTSELPAPLVATVLALLALAATWEPRTRPSTARHLRPTGNPPGRGESAP